MNGLLCLKWNNHSPAFLKKLGRLRGKELYCDATIVCQNKYYPVHKLVLSTCSEYFEEIFEKIQCKHPFIIVKDIDPTELEALLNYMYKGEVNVLQELLPGLIKAAEYLQIKGLAVPDDDDGSYSSSNKKAGMREKRSHTASPSPLSKKSRRSDDRNTFSSTRRRQSDETDRGFHGQSDIEKVYVREDPLFSDCGTEDINNFANIERTDNSVEKQAEIVGREMDIKEVSLIKEEPTESAENECDDPNDENVMNFPFDETAAKVENFVSMEESSLGVEDTALQDQPQCSTWDDVIPSLEGADQTSHEGVQEMINQFCTTTRQETSCGTTGSQSIPQDYSKMDLPLYTCPHCQYSTYVKASIRVHIMRRHTKERPFACPVCPYKGSTKDNLNKHKKNKHCSKSRFKCPRCPYSSSINANVKRHFMVHTGEKPFHCPHCQYSASQLSGLKIHVQKHRS